jgi:ADP-ribose pyrophosphatase YjhB (NUDIX family)
MKAGFDYVGISTPFYCNDGKGNFLLHKRSKNCRDEQGKWDFGGGQLDFGLSLEDNVLKEVKEEYGCKGKIQKAVPPMAIFRHHNGVLTHWIVFPFFIKVNKRDVKINDLEKIDEIGWFRFSNLPKPLHTGFKQTYKKYRSYFDNF